MTVKFSRLSSIFLSSTRGCIQQRSCKYFHASCAVSQSLPTLPWLYLEKPKLRGAHGSLAPNGCSWLEQFYQFGPISEFSAQNFIIANLPKSGGGSVVMAPNHTDHSAGSKWLEQRIEGNYFIWNHPVFGIAANNHGKQLNIKKIMNAPNEEGLTLITRTKSCTPMPAGAKIIVA